MTSLKPNSAKQDTQMINYDHFNLLMYNDIRSQPAEIVKHVQYTAKYVNPSTLYEKNHMREVSKMEVIYDKPFAASS